MARPKKAYGLVGKASSKAVAAGWALLRPSGFERVVEISVEGQIVKSAKRKGRLIPPVEEIGSQRQQPGRLKGKIPELGKTLMDESPLEDVAAWSEE